MSNVAHGPLVLIADYLMIDLSVSNAQLMGANSRDAAFVQQWINFADNEVLPASCTWVFPCLGIMQFNKQVIKLFPEYYSKNF